MLGALKLSEMGAAMQSAASLAETFVRIARAIDRLEAEARETNALLRRMLEEKR